MIEKMIQLPGMIAISFDEHGNAFIQFVPDESYAVVLDSLLLEGSAQLLCSGQFEFISEKVKQLRIK